MNVYTIVELERECEPIFTSSLHIVKCISMFVSAVNNVCSVNLNGRTDIDNMIFYIIIKLNSSSTHSKQLVAADSFIPKPIYSAAAIFPFSLFNLFSEQIIVATINIPVRWCVEPNKQNRHENVVHRRLHTFSGS